MVIKYVRRGGRSIFLKIQKKKCLRLKMFTPPAPKFWMPPLLAIFLCPPHFRRLQRKFFMPIPLINSLVTPPPPPLPTVIKWNGETLIVVLKYPTPRGKLIQIIRKWQGNSTRSLAHKPPFEGLNPDLQGMGRVHRLYEHIILCELKEPPRSWGLRGGYYGDTKYLPAWF